MATDQDIRCSNACTRAGISILILSAVALGMFTPLDKTRNHQNLLTYLSQRLILKEQVARLDTDVAWRALMAGDTAEQARKDWNLIKLLDYTIEEELKPRYPAPKTGPSKQPGEQSRPAHGAPAAPTNLRMVATRRIEPLHRASEALGELGNGDGLTRARRYSPSADRAIYDWTMLRHDLIREGKARNNPGMVFIEGNRQPASFLSRFWSVGERSFVPTVSRDEMIKTLSVAQLSELANHQSPNMSESETLLKEQASVTLPALGVAVSVFQGSTLVEFGLLLSLAYFWLYYREARVSQKFPSSATLFGGIARSALTRGIFFWSPVIPAIAAAILAKKSFWFSSDNAVVAALVVLMAIAIRHPGRVPKLVHEEGETGGG